MTNAELAEIFSALGNEYAQLTTSTDFNKELWTINKIGNTELRDHLWGVLLLSALRKKIFFSHKKGQFVHSPLADAENVLQTIGKPKMARFTEGHFYTTQGSQ